MTNSSSNPGIDRILSGAKESQNVQDSFFQENAENLLKAFEKATHSLRSGGKLMIMGNGGSAADAQHVAAELVARFEKERRALPAIALTTDSSILTAIGNDYDFKYVFSRQIEALGRPDDFVVAISTSGNSANILEGVRMAGKMGIFTLALTGGDGGLIRKAADLTLCVSTTSRTCRIQETMLVMEHLLCEWIEAELCS